MSAYTIVGLIFFIVGFAALCVGYLMLNRAESSLRDALACLDEGRTIVADLVYDLAQEAWERGDIGKPDGVEAWVWLKARAAQFQAIHDRAGNA